MQTFKDREGRTWKIDLTFGDVLRVKAADARFDLLNPSAPLAGSSLPSTFVGEPPQEHPPTLHQVLYDDFPTLWEAIWHIIEPQAIAASVTAEQFGQSMPPACLIDARSALWREWADFFRGLQRPDQAKALELQAAYQAKAVELVTQRIGGPEIEAVTRRMNDRMTAIANDSFGSLAESLDSILGPSPGGS
jgi:hypothetical protein